MSENKGQPGQVKVGNDDNISPLVKEEKRSLVSDQVVTTMKFVMKTYNTIFSYNFVGALIVSLLLGLVVLLRYNFGAVPGEPSIFLITVFAGTMGAFISSLTRMYRFTDLPTAIVKDDVQLGGLTLIAYSLTPALIGTISASVLYFAVAGELLSGSIFPEFGCSDASSCSSVSSLINNYGPKHAQDYAKLIFWGFVAGFSERMVPDMVDRMVRSSNAALTPAK